MNSLNFRGIVGSYSYKFMIDKYDTWLNSNEFAIEGIDNCNFQIRVYEKKEPHSLQISVKKSNEKRTFAKITISFHEKEVTRVVDDWTDICSFTSELSGSIKNITIICNIVWYGTVEDFSLIPAPLNLFSDFKNFHLNSSLSDLQISISGEELPAHKFILAVHSPVFLSMFETDMREKNESRIVIEGIELSVMKIVLSISYTGYDKELDEVEMAMKVMIVAERYDMKTLKRLCEWKLCQKLAISNVLDIFDGADHCNAEKLRAECLNFIVQNKVQMTKSDDWKSACHRQPNLMNRLVDKFMTTP